MAAAVLSLVSEHTSPTEKLMIHESFNLPMTDETQPPSSLSSQNKLPQ